MCTSLVAKGLRSVLSGFSLKVFLYDMKIDKIDLSVYGTKKGQLGFVSNIHKTQFMDVKHMDHSPKMSSQVT